MQPKPKYQSVTLIGAALTIAGLIASWLGYDVSDQLQQLVEPISKIAEVVGVIITVVGRLRPAGGYPLTQAQANLQARK